MDDKILHTNQLGNNHFPEPDIPVDEAWAEMKTLLSTPTPKIDIEKYSKPKPRNFFFYAAAGLFIVSVLGIYFSKVKKSDKPAATIVYESQDKPQKDTLLGGGVVFLDKQSMVSELAELNNYTSIIVKGAAFFQNSVDERQMPSGIKVGSLIVSPTNASLYLSYDSALNVSSVHVQSGVATVEVNGEKLTLSAGEALQYDEKAKGLSSKQAIDINLFSFATLIFEFNDTPLIDAAKAIEKAYGVSIVMDNSKMFNCRITTRFDNKSLDEVLDVMGYTLGFEHVIDKKNNQVFLNGDGCE